MTRTVLVAGCGGMLGRDLTALLEEAKCPAVGLDLPGLDITNPLSVQACFDDIRPGLIVNCAAYTDVDRAETDREAAFSANRDGPAHLADACRRTGIPLIHVSTDYVFEGTAGRPCREDDLVRPAGVYAASKWEGEQAIRSRLPRHFIVRSSWLFGAQGRNFVKTMLRLAKDREELRVVADQYGCPTWTVDLGRALVQLCLHALAGAGEPAWGTYHFCGEGPVNWHNFAEAIIEEGRKHTRLRCARVLPITTAEYPCAAARPAWSVLDCSKITAVFGIIPPSWRRGLEETVSAIYREESVGA